MNSLTIYLDGRPITATAGQTVWQAARGVGIEIPALCASPNLKPHGSCRLCLCEIEGQRGFPASCTTPVRDGLRVRTDSLALNQLRRNILELYLSEQPEDALSASDTLRTLASRFGLQRIRYRRPKRRQYARDESNPYFAFDPNKCIACARCVRACDEIQGTFAITMYGR
ncbi:MAG: 2Fe-2S iron-sulfur cluster-binding protein, partial [Verrucomicrobiae bacterium]|nr:2Fe-2S iron-sulfur cluster-binding protein [Verrucomicrobiae bacterium]